MVSEMSSLISLSDVSNFMTKSMEYSVPTFLSSGRQPWYPHSFMSRNAIEFLLIETSVVLNIFCKSTIFWVIINLI